jgi:hypothetical protein
VQKQPPDPSRNQLNNDFVISLLISNYKVANLGSLEVSNCDPSTGGRGRSIPLHGINEVLQDFLTDGVLAKYPARENVG